MWTDSKGTVVMKKPCRIASHGPRGRGRAQEAGRRHVRDMQARGRWEAGRRQVEGRREEVGKQAGGRHFSLCTAQSKSTMSIEMEAQPALCGWYVGFSVSLYIRVCKMRLPSDSRHGAWVIGSAEVCIIEPTSVSPQPGAGVV
jgi:hypothetical protein